VQLQTEINRIEQCLTFLHANSCNISKAEYRGIYEEELGCRIMQDVISGNIASPYFVHKLKKGTPDTKEPPGFVNGLSPSQQAENHLL
jgi:hypothetical protein